MAITVGELKKILNLVQESNLVCINGTIIDYAEINRDNEIAKTTDVTLMSASGELTKDNLRKSRLRAAGVNVQ